MAHLALTLMVLVGQLALVSLSVITITEKSTGTENEEKEFSKKPYIFPEIHDGNALQPTLDLLLSQKCYHDEMDRIYQRMLKKNENAQNLKQVDAMIFNTRIMLNTDIETLQEYLTTGAPHDDVKRQPWCGASSFSILNSWRTIVDLCVDMRDQKIDKEIEALLKVVNSAIHEMEVYEKYSDMMYDETLKTTTAEELDNDYPFPDTIQQAVEKEREV